MILTWTLILCLPLNAHLFVFDMHSGQIKTFNASFTDKEITFLFRLNNGCKVS